MSIDNDTLVHLGDVEDPIELRNFLLLVIQQIDLIIGNRHAEVDHTHDKVEPSASYVQSEAVAIADDAHDIHNRIEALEARLVPVNN